MLTLGGAPAEPSKPIVGAWALWSPGNPARTLLIGERGKWLLPATHTQKGASGTWSLKDGEYSFLCGRKKLYASAVLDADEGQLAWSRDGQELTGKRPTAAPWPVLSTVVRD